MPLYLCRPFSRAEYVLGKMSVLVFLLSLITWVPGLILFVIQAQPGGLGLDRGRTCWIAGSLFVGLGGVDPDAVAARAGAFRLGEVEDRGRSAGARRLLRGRGIRHGPQRRAAHQVRLAAEPDRGDVTQSGPSCSALTPETRVFRSKPAWMLLGVVCAICLWLLVRRVRAFEVVK